MFVRANICLPCFIVNSFLVLAVDCRYQHRVIVVVLCLSPICENITDACCQFAVPAIPVYKSKISLSIISSLHCVSYSLLDFVCMAADLDRVGESVIF